MASSCQIYCFLSSEYDLEGSSMAWEKNNKIFGSSSPCVEPLLHSICSWDCMVPVVHIKQRRLFCGLIGFFPRHGGRHRHPAAGTSSKSHTWNVIQCPFCFGSLVSLLSGNFSSGDFYSQPLKCCKTRIKYEWFLLCHMCPVYYRSSREREQLIYVEQKRNMSEGKLSKHLWISIRMFFICDETIQCHGIAIEMQVATVWRGEPSGTRSWNIHTESFKSQSDVSWAGLVSHYPLFKWITRRKAHCNKLKLLCGGGGRRVARCEHFAFMHEC